MKTTGIITIHNSPNYGACLQSYALYKYLEDKGCEVEIIDLHRPNAYEDYVPSKRYTCSRPVKLSLKQRAVKKLKSILGIRKRKISLYNPIAKEKFDAFNASIKLSRPYRSIEDLYANPPEYDLYISGSDQLWNPTQAYCIEPYFLTFVPHGRGQKISYATSIGITELRNNEKSYFKKWLEHYDGISVREHQAKELLSSFVDKDIEQVADPTFLISLDVWRSVAVLPDIEQPYILLFTLSYNPTMLEYARRLSAESGKHLIALGQIQPLPKEGEYLAVTDAGPREFMGYIQQADMVLTDSFHCTVFSLLMGSRNFYTYIAPSNHRGSRIVDLLSTFGLEAHLLDCSLCQSWEELDKKTINHNEIETVIEKESIRSQAFLDKYISNE